MASSECRIIASTESFATRLSLIDGAGSSASPENSNVTGSPSAAVASALSTSPSTSSSLVVVANPNLPSFTNLNAAPRSSVLESDLSLPDS